MMNNQPPFVFLGYGELIAVPSRHKSEPHLRGISFVKQNTTHEPGTKADGVELKYEDLLTCLYFKDENAVQRLIDDLLILKNTFNDE